MAGYPGDCGEVDIMRPSEGRVASSILASRAKFYPKPAQPWLRALLFQRPNGKVDLTVGRLVDLSRAIQSL